MADDPHEGWQVPFGRGVIAVVAAPVALLLIVLVGSHFYDSKLRPSTRQPVTTFPAPGLETHITRAPRDRDRVTRQRASDPSMEQAKRDAVAAGWRGLGQ